MSEWNNNKLSHLVDIRVSNVDKKIYPNKKKVKLCNYMDVYSNDYITSRINYSEGSADLNELNRFSLIPKDVIITKDSETPEDIAVSSVVIEEINNLVCGYHLAILRPRENRIYGPFLMHKLKLPQVQKYFFRIASGSTRYGLTIGGIENTVLSHPQIPHQRKIARILTTVDNIIEKTESSIEKYKAIKQGMMHDLFTRGIDVKTGKLRPSYEDAPELYKETELGMIPKEWKLDKLENITHYVDYRGKTPPKSETGIFLITAKNIKDGFIDYEISKEYIPVYAFESTMSRGKANIRDVVITTEAPLGNVAQIDFEGMALAQRVIKYRGKENILMNDFLKQSLMSDYFQKLIHSESTGSTVKGIKGSRLHKQPLLIPELREQSAISITILQQEAIISSEQQYLNKQKKLKQALMQDLLTGKKEVTPDPEDFDRE